MIISASVPHGNCNINIKLLLFLQNKQVAQRATIAHLSPMCQGQISFQKIQTHPSFNACSCYMKVSKGSNQKQQRKSGNTIFPIIRSIGVFLRRSRAANSVVGGPIWPKFELIHNIMHVLVTSKFEKDRININRLHDDIDFLDAQKSVVGSVRNSNSYKLLCMSSLPASMKRIRSQ